MTDCELVCITGGKAMDAMKEEDYPRAIQLLIRAHDICLVGDCACSEICQPVEYALMEAVEGDYNTAMKHLRKLWEVCNKK